MTAKQIQTLRRARKESTKQFGDFIGVSARTVQGWEQGRKPSEMARRVLKDLASTGTR